jgi:hypothetical protein
MPPVTSRWGFAEGKTPGGQNPRSDTHLKMVGRLGVEEVAERLGKPGSDTVAGGWDRW